MSSVFVAARSKAGKEVSFHHGANQAGNKRLGREKLTTF